jgi:hypothetical protein
VYLRSPRGLHDIAEQEILHSCHQFQTGFEY